MLLEQTSPRRLLHAADAAVELMDCTRQLADRRRSVLDEVIGGCQKIEAWTHYPQADVVDLASGSRCYYHCHSGRHPDSNSTPQQPSGPHGHFHLFAQPPGLRGHAAAADLTHLGGLALDDRGLPAQLFTNNLWVTGGRWRDAAATLKLLDRFAIRGRKPSLVFGRWMTAAVRMFYPQWRELLLLRDARLRRARPREQVLQDRRMQILSWTPVSIEMQVAALQTALI